MFLAALVTIITLAIFKSRIEADVTTLDIVWRILAFFGVIPALTAVYWRRKMTQSPRFTFVVERNPDQASKYSQRGIFAMDD